MLRSAQPSQFSTYPSQYIDTPGLAVLIYVLSAITALLQANLDHHPDVRFGADFSAQKVSKDDLVGFDLCVLATSHHSVHTYGTFGLWGSLLAGGDVVVTKGRVEVGLSSGKPIIPRF